MEELVDDLLREIPRAFESEDHERHREGLRAKCRSSTTSRLLNWNAK
jgi:hypothetical protein